MYYNEFQDIKLSALGLGTMRLPTMEDGRIDREKLKEMVKLALDSGINYFDTAWTYHGGESEIAIGEALREYPRDSWQLATKYPGHEIHDSYDPAAIFEKQLKKAGVDYFDFYLLHNVFESSIDTYLDPQWGIIDYFLEQKRLGRIKHLGFSCHALTENLRRFLDAAGDKMEFCQIQLNWLDWSLQDAKGKYELLTERNIPVWVMEPVRGGTLADLSPENNARLRAIEPDKSVASWGFRFLQGLPNVTMVLSGMSNIEQMQDNLKTFSQREPITEAQTALLLDIAEGMKGSIPCTACRYCTAGCPMELDIPMLLRVYNDIRYSPSITSAMAIEVLPEEKKPTACVNCGSCMKICPQHIEIPRHMRDFSEALGKIPSWREICRQREEAAKNKE